MAEHPAAARLRQRAQEQRAQALREAEAAQAELPNILRSLRSGAVMDEALSRVAERCRRAGDLQKDASLREQAARVIDQALEARSEVC